MSKFVKAKALVGITKSGYTGRQLAMHRPKSEIYLFTENKYLLRQVSLIWGVQAFHFKGNENINDTLSKIETKLKNEGLLETGDVFINTASMPEHWQGHTNMMKVNITE